MLAAFLVALVASLAVHLPVYEVLGALADRLAQQPAPVGAAPPSTVEFDVDWASTPANREPEPDDNKPKKAKDKPKLKPKVAQAKPAQVKPAPAEPENKQAVQQRSQDPDVEAPDTNFIAEQNNRVEEETVARLRNYMQDQPDPTAGVAPEADPKSLEEGNSAEQKIADLRDREGSEARTATLEETLKQRPKDAPKADPISGARVTNNSAKKTDARADNLAPADQADRSITITDAAGTFTVTRPSGSAGRGGKSKAGKQGPNLKLSWSAFETALGEKNLKESRYARIKERKSKQSGASRQKRWKEFRAAIENFTPAVKPGNQTALNAKASPFANYIATVHRRIHREFADEFLASLPTMSGHPFADTSLRTKLEIVLNGDGSVHHIGVAKTSGLLPFDFGAFNSVMKGQPYPKPPKAILSGDGRVYLHWAFYRNHRQCGTFNAEPYVLPNPPGTPRKKNLFRDGPDWGTTVPDDAEPTWGTDEESQAPSGSNKPKHRDDKRRDDKGDRPPKVSPPPRGAAVG